VIDHVVVPLDGSDRAEAALPHARVLARVFGAEVHLVRVIPPGRAGGITRDAVEWRLAEADASRYLESWGRRLRETGTSASTEVLEGEPAREIVTVLRAREDDLVVLTPHGRGGATEYRLGGTAQKIVAEGGASLLLVRPAEGGEEDGPYRSILVPVDGSSRGDWALCTAASIARAVGARLVVAHVVATPERVPGPAPESTGSLEDRLLERCTEAARRYLSGRREQLSAPDLEVETRIVASGHVTGALHRLASEIGADLMVVSAHGRSGAAPWPYGSVAGNLLTYAGIPVLVLQDQPRSGEETRAGRGRVDHRTGRAPDLPAVGPVPS
jgi:nucleotide-binding universal stress UspA family protein